MSTAASLAAAKKRRGPQYQQTNIRKTEEKNISKTELLTNRQILTRHEQRFYKIEFLLKNLLEEYKSNDENKYVTKEEIHNLNLDNKNGLFNDYLKDLAQTKNEINKLKNTITKLNKDNNQMSIIIAQLKSNLLNNKKKGKNEKDEEDVEVEQDEENEENEENEQENEENQ